MAESNRVKLKQAAPKITDPGNSSKSAIIKGKHKKKPRATPTPSTIASPGPVVNQLSDSHRETFPTGRPLEDSLDLQICSSCKRPFLASALTEHTKKCNGIGSGGGAGEKEKKLKVKKNRALDKEIKAKAMEKDKDKDRDKDKGGDTIGDEGEDDGIGDEDGDGEGEGAPGGKVGLKKGAKKSAGKAAAAGVGITKGKKRKAENEPEKAPKTKKKKEEPKPKIAKPKGPVDVERQCGVITPSGVPCARSLTCKSHSMGLKRSVPGRSRPYDTLLAAYQKKNQAKQQKAALDATAPLVDEEEEAGGLDSDEECAAVLSGARSWRGGGLGGSGVGGGFVGGGGGYGGGIGGIDSRPIKDAVKSIRIQQQLQETLSAEGNIFAVKRWGFVSIPGHPACVGRAGDGDDGTGAGAGYRGPGSIGYVGPMPVDGLGRVSVIEPVGMDFGAVEEASGKVEREGILGRGFWE